MKKAGLIECSWERICDKNVKLCYSIVKQIIFDFKNGKAIIQLQDKSNINSLEIKTQTKANIPTPRKFIGRKRFLDKLYSTNKPVIVVWGFPGIGKTYLVSKYVHGLDRPVFWYTIVSFSDLRHFVWKLANTLNSYGYKNY